MLPTEGQRELPHDQKYQHWTFTSSLSTVTYGLTISTLFAMSNKKLSSTAGSSKASEPSIFFTAKGKLSIQDAFSYDVAKASHTMQHRNLCSHAPYLRTAKTKY